MYYVCKEIDLNVTASHRSLILTCLLIAVFITACTDRVPESRTDTFGQTQGLLPDEILYESDISLSEQGRKKLLIESSYLERYSTIDSALMTGIEATFFDSIGKVTSTLVSDSGIIREQSGRLHVWGQVRVVSDNGVTLEADSLFWDQEKDSVTTDSFVKITRKGNIQTGYGLQADNRLTNIRIKRQITGEFENPEAVKKKD